MATAKKSADKAAPTKAPKKAAAPKAAKKAAAPKKEAGPEVIPCREIFVTGQGFFTPDPGTQVTRELDLITFTSNKGTHTFPEELVAIGH